MIIDATKNVDKNGPAPLIQTREDQKKEKSSKGSQSKMRSFRVDHKANTKKSGDE